MSSRLLRDASCDLTGDRFAFCARRSTDYDAAMFRFVYALPADEPADAAWATDGFVGVESDAPRDGLPWVGSRNRAAGGPAYVVQSAAGRDASAVAVGRQLRQSADQHPGRLLLIENGGAFSTPLSLWTLMEAARHPRVKLAIDIDTADTAGQTAAVLVPTLNLRIGLVRARSVHPGVVDYARRLAGIGFEGWVVIDPLAGPDRAEAAGEIAAIFRGVFPTKAAKKAPAATAAR